MKTLSKTQLAVMGQLATKAYRKLQSVGYPLPTYDVWRHEVTAELCSATSWRECVQTDYVPLCNYFRALIGLSPMPDRTPKTEEEAMLGAICDRLQHWEASPAYIAAIVKGKTGRAVHGGMTWQEMMGGLPAKTLKQLLYTFQARLRAKVNKQAEALGVPPAHEVHTSRSTMPPARLAEYRGDTLVHATPKPRPRRCAAEGRREVGA